MYEQQRASSRDDGAANQAAAGAKIGGNPLIQPPAYNDRARPPMFAGAVPAWEAIDPAEAAQATEAAPAAAPQAMIEPPLPPLAAHTAATAAPSTDVASVPATPTADALPVAGDELADDAAGTEHDAEAPAAHDAHAARAATTPAAAKPKDPLHIAGKTNPHGGPFESKSNSQAHAAIDGYNRGTVHSDKATAHSFGRPGVVSHGHGLFQLKVDATRYTYTAQGKTNVAAPFDVIKKDKLLSINSVAPHLSAHDKAKHKKEVAAGRSVRLALNPAMPRQLQIDGVATWCVLSWADGFGGGAAWIPVKDLVGNTSQIRHDVQHRAAHENPSTKLAPSSPYVIRGDAIGQADAQDKEHKGRVLAAGAHGGDNVSHYLEKDARKPEFQGGKPTGHNVDRGFVALCMNLPEGRTPPVADDTALLGDTFFAFDDKKFHREVAVYENGAKASHRRQTWVFGHLGKAKGGTGPDAAEMEPDPKRAGWVPLRVLKLA